MTETLSFEPFQVKHLAGAMRMSANVGWPHRIEDWAFVAGLSKGVVAQQGDEVVATALATPFGQVAMVNLIIVDAAMRGRGLGRDIMCRALDTVTPTAWQLVATQDGLPLYEKLGFETIGEIVQHQGLVVPADTEPERDECIGWATADDITDLLAMDYAATGMDRATLYAALVAEAQFAVLRQSGRITGFAAVRPFGRGEVAGPVIAQNVEDAQSLLSAIMASRAGQFLRVDTGADSGLSEWLTTRGLVHAGGGLQMQKGEHAAPPASPYSVFGLASQALG